MACKRFCPTINIRHRLKLFQYPADNWPNIHILTSALQIICLTIYHDAKSSLILANQSWPDCDTVLRLIMGLKTLGRCSYGGLNLPNPPPWLRHWPRWYFLWMCYNQIHVLITSFDSSLGSRRSREFSKIIGFKFPKSAITSVFNFVIIILQA